MEFHYSAYGLAIRSQIALPYLITRPPGPFDVDITRAPVEMGVDRAARRYRNWEATPERFRIEIADLARIEVSGGNSIRVDNIADGDPRDLIAHIQGSALAALLQQRGMLPMHASCVETSGGALLVAGPSGIGKSTTLGALLDRGFRMMADDVTGIQGDGNGLPIAYAGFPATRLWQDSAVRLGVDADRLDPVRADIDKYYLPVERFRPDPLPIAAIVVLGEHNAPEIEIAPLPPADRIQALVRYSFRKKFMAGMGLQPFHFEAVVGIAKHVTMVRVRRPQLPFDPFALADRIVDRLGVAPVG